MFRLFALLISLAVFAPQAYALRNRCYNLARTIARANGGENVKLYRNEVTGWGVNTSGYISYTYTRGNEECYVAFSVYGTYFHGTQCDENYGFIRGDGSPNCGPVGSWTNHK